MKQANLVYLQFLKKFKQISSPNFIKLRMSSLIMFSNTSLCIVCVCDCSEPQARRIVSDGCIGDNMENAGDILNNKGTMEYTPGQGQMSIAFRNMQLKKIKRADRKGQEVS